MYLPGCPPRPEMLLDAILKIHDQIKDMKLGKQREKQVIRLEDISMKESPLIELKGLLS
jgi:NADH-quinone oxidoreductase subunit B